MKIVYCLNSISHLGGIANVTITKANALSEIEGNDVSVCVSDYLDNEISRKLSPKVKLIDLDVNYYKDDWKSSWHLLKSTIVKRKIHKHRLKKALEEIHPDIVISAGQSEKYFLPSINGTGKTVRELHFNTDYRDFSSQNKTGRFLNKLIALYDYKWKIRRYDQIVLLTEEDRQRNWSCNKKVAVIPNPVTLKPGYKSSLNTKKIISIGRLEYQKNFSSLIKAFSHVAEKHPEWVLEIYGTGSLQGQLENQIEGLGLKDKALIQGVTFNPEEKLLDSSVFVLSSRFEGFGLVILEAMASGVPVVSYDCPSGPKDIITDGVDGFLVPSGNENLLAEKIIFMIENHEKRKAMGVAAIKKAKNFSLDKITSKWMDLFQELIQ